MCHKLVGLIGNSVRGDRVWMESWLRCPSTSWLLFCPICEGFRCGYRVPERGARQHVLGQQKVCLSLNFCVLCACVWVCASANLLWGGSTRISIIRGFWGPPPSPPQRLTSLSHHPSAALPSIRLLILPSPSPPYPSILPSVSLPPLNSSFSSCTPVHPTPPTSSSYT